MMVLVVDCDYNDYDLKIYLMSALIIMEIIINNQAFLRMKIT